MKHLLVFRAKSLGQLPDLLVVSGLCHSGLRSIHIFENSINIFVGRVADNFHFPISRSEKEINQSGVISHHSHGGVIQSDHGVLSIGIGFLWGARGGHGTSGYPESNRQPKQKVSSGHHDQIRPASLAGVCSVHLRRSTASARCETIARIRHARPITPGAINGGGILNDSPSTHADMVTSHTCWPRVRSTAKSSTIPEIPTDTRSAAASRDDIGFMGADTEPMPLICTISYLGGGGRSTGKRASCLSISAFTAGLMPRFRSASSHASISASKSFL